MMFFKHWFVPGCVESGLNKTKFLSLNENNNIYCTFI
jgi:hypothetical protein